MKPIQLIGFFILSFIIKWINTYITGGSINYALILGSALGLFVFALITVFVIKGLFKLAKANFSESAFFKTYLITWLLFALFGFVGSLKDDSKIKNEEQLFIYSPESCLYEITFSGKPIIKAASVSTNDAFFNGEIAEINLKDRGFQRVEFYLVDSLTLENIDKESLMEILNQYSVQNGLHNPEFTYREGDYGKNLEMRAYKTLTNKQNKEVNITYIASLYTLGNNLVTLYAGCESEKFPTSEINRFLNSIKNK